MKRYTKANENIHTPDALRRQVLAGPRSAAPRRVAVLATAVVLLIAVAAVGAAFSRRGEAPDAVPLLTTAAPDTTAPDTTATNTTAPDTTAPDTTVPPQTQQVEGMLPLQLTEVAYPTMTPYPLDYLSPEGYTLDGYYEAYRAWQDDQQARRNQPAGYDAGLDETARALMRQFLTATDKTAGENRVISPLNLYLALAMLTEVTDTTSRAALLDLLHADSIETLRGQAASIWTANYVDDGESTTRFAASLWLAEGLPYRGDTLTALARHHYAQSFQGKMGSDALNQALRDWINTNTGGLLKEQASGLSFDPETVLGLATTIYYQSKWSDSFFAGATADRTFHAASGDLTVPFMSQREWSTYLRGEGFGAVRKGLSQGAMWLILPDEGVTTDDLLAGDSLYALIDTPDLTRWPSSTHTYVDIAMPKFDVAADLDLRDGLAALGLGELFSDATADFSPITDDAVLADRLCLSQAKHAARVKVDEEGCEAAAYTLITVVPTSARLGEPIAFVLDRPFIFVVTSAAGAPLFAGVVEQP